MTEKKTDWTEEEIEEVFESARKFIDKNRPVPMTGASGSKSADKFFSSDFERDFEMKSDCTAHMNE